MGQQLSATRLAISEVPLVTPDPDIVGRGGSVIIYSSPTETRKVHDRGFSAPTGSGQRKRLGQGAGQAARVLNCQPRGKGSPGGIIVMRLDARAVAPVAEGPALGNYSLIVLG